jgi:hypothetical protein
MLAAAAVAVFALAGAAWAYINPGYTPVNLVEQADYILILKLSAPDKKGKVKAEIVKCLKGKKKAPKGPLSIDLTITAMKAHAKEFKERIKSIGKEPVLLFVGRGENDVEASMLHMTGRWFSLDKTDKANLFELHKRDDRMEGTWAGGSDMLLKITELLIKYPDTDVPVASGVKWDKEYKITKIKGKVTEVRAPDLDGKGKLRLYVGCDSGDRIFFHDKKTDKFAEETAKRKLTSKSLVSTWADFNADGRLDLASWDGKTLSIYAQAADGTFAAGKKVAAAPAGKCLGLAVVGVGGKPGLIWSAPGGPTLLKPGAGGVFTAVKLALGKVDVAKLGDPNRCLVGDIDDDSLVDVFWPLAKGSVFFRGKGSGEFAAGAKRPVQIGRSPGSSFLGDWDMDGRLDVFCMADDGCRLWHNRAGEKPGEFKFQATIHICGELAYISKPGGLWGNVCDVNNDGRQDIFFVYSDQPGNGPHIFFNRGFRSFGHAHQLDISEQQNIGGVEAKGQQHGVIADLTADYAQDMAVVLKNGDLYVFPRELADDDPLCVQAELPVGGKVVGPVKVTAWNEQRCLGAWNVLPGTHPAFFGQMEAGDIVLKWRLPGAAKVQTKKVTLDEKPIRLKLK